MLVLSRKRNEKIIIGEGANQVRLVITNIKGDKVRIGLEAAASVPIHREEVYDAIQRDGEQRKERESA
jgi:carbon storage regulator